MASKKQREERKRDMIALREHGLTLQEIGDKYGITKQSVWKVIGNTGWLENYKKTEDLHNYIRGNPLLTNSQLANKLNLAIRTVGKIRAGQRYKVDGKPNNSRKVGTKWENWAIAHLETMGFDVRAMPYNHPFDLLVDGNRVDVKAGLSKKIAPSLDGRLISPQWKFHIGVDKRRDCDYYFCITGNKDVFVIPSIIIPEHVQKIQFCYPTKRPEISKYLKYHNAYWLLASR
jgi:predicted DNA-binding protein YlxM (UPF0122 family)